MRKANYFKVMMSNIIVDECKLTISLITTKIGKHKFAEYHHISFGFTNTYYILGRYYGGQNLQLYPYFQFWMWKFRNISRPWKGAGDAQHRTYLQASVFSFIAVATAIPSLVSLALIVILVQKTTTRARITFCYGIYIGIYGSYFVLAIIDTDQCKETISIFFFVLFA